MDEISRRSAIGAGAGLLALTQACATAGGAASSFTTPQATSPDALARDASYWARVAAQYDVTSEITQLENGNWGVVARPVMDVHRAKLEMVNRRNSYWQRREYPEEYRAIADRTAKMLGVSPEEIVFTRNATEALHALISGYNRLRPGDQVLFSDHDYDSMIPAMQWLKQRRGVDAISTALPEPATMQGVLDAYAAALKANPRIRLILLTHLGHRSGLVIPVAEIADMARAAGADVIVDAAHSFGQIDFRLPDLRSDFIGINLHKWIGAPLGVGLAYIKRERIPDIDPHFGTPGSRTDTIEARVHPGTVSWASYLSVPAAIDFHETIGVANKAARLQYLRDQWAEPARLNPNIEVLTPSDRRMHAGITSFRLKGRTSNADNIALAKRLLDDHGIFTVHRIGLANGACIRVTPALFTSDADVERLNKALATIAA